MASSSTDASFIVWGSNRTASAPMELTTLISWVRDERVTPDTWIFVNKAGAWQRALDVEELQWFFQVRSGRRPETADDGSIPHGFDPRALRRLKLLAGMTDEQLERFAEFTEVLRVPLSSTIVKQGDHGDAMYLILEGELS